MSLRPKKVWLSLLEPIQAENCEGRNYLVEEGRGYFQAIIKEYPDFSFKELLGSRCWIYRFLSISFYQEPTWPNFCELSSTNLFRNLLDQDSDENSGLELLASFIDALPAMSAGEWEELRQEYLRLFVGPGKVLAPPWASVYLSKERIIFDENTLAVRKFYRDWNLETVNYKKEPDDHIGLELGFMAILSERTLAAYEKGQEEVFRPLLQGQGTFLQDYLLPWVAGFCQQILDHSNQPLYRGLALFTPLYLEMDAGLLAELKNEGSFHFQYYCEGGYRCASGKTEST